LFKLYNTTKKSFLNGKLAMGTRSYFDRSQPYSALLLELELSGLSTVP
jgi:hypothetical protein